METSDEALAKAAASGDAQAFSSLITRHYDRVFRLSFRLTGARTEAEDLTQDIAAALPAKLAAFRSEARFTTWLYRVVVNAAHDRRRRQASHTKAAEGWGDMALAQSAEADERRDAQNWLNTAMGALPPDLRDTLALVLDDMTHAEAATILDVSEGTISWRMSEAKKHLRAMKEADDG